MSAGRPLALLQARCSSRRLPGKVLAELGGKPLVRHAVDRLRRARRLRDVMVVTSRESSDDPLAEYCLAEGIPLFRGSLDDVLDRYYRAASAASATSVLRATADCPFLDPELVDRVCEIFEAERCDYAANVLERTYPKGLDVEALRFEALAEAWRSAEAPGEREHVTVWVRERPGRFRFGSVRQDEDQSAMRWTVDEPADLEFARAVVRALGRDDFDRHALLELLARRPEVAAINAHVT